MEWTWVDFIILIGAVAKSSCRIIWQKVAKQIVFLVIVKNLWIFRELGAWSCIINQIRTSVRLILNVDFATITTNKCIESTIESTHFSSIISHLNPFLSHFIPFVYDSIVFINKLAINNVNRSIISNAQVLNTCWFQILIDNFSIIANKNRNIIS